MNGELETSLSEPLVGNCTWCKRSLARWQHVPVDPLKQTLNRHANAYWCEDCGHGSLQPLPSEAQIADLYHFDTYYTHMRPLEAEAPKASFLDRVRTHLAYRLDRGLPLTREHVHHGLGGKPRSICDLGCGNGELAASLVELGHTVVGVEVDPAALQGRVAGDYRVLVGTAERLPKDLPRRSFDAVVMRHVLEHCRDPILALKNAGSLLAPGGTLFCEVPNNEALGLTFSGAAWAMFDLPRHLHFFSQRSLERACRAAGLRVKQSHFANYHRQFTNEWIDDERTLFRRMTHGVHQEPNPVLSENSRARAWRLLLSTMRLPAAHRYDSIGVLATRD